MNINKKKVILNNNSSNDLSVINTTSLMNRTNVNNSENKKNIQKIKTAFKKNKGIGDFKINEISNERYKPEMEFKRVRSSQNIFFYNKNKQNKYGKNIFNKNANIYVGASIYSAPSVRENRIEINKLIKNEKNKQLSYLNNIHNRIMIKESRQYREKLRSLSKDNSFDMNTQNNLKMKYNMNDMNDINSIKANLQPNFSGFFLRKRNKRNFSSYDLTLKRYKFIKQDSASNTNNNNFLSKKKILNNFNDNITLSTNKTNYFSKYLSGKKTMKPIYETNNNNHYRKNDINFLTSSSKITSAHTGNLLNKNNIKFDYITKKPLLLKNNSNLYLYEKKLNKENNKSEGKKEDNSYSIYKNIEVSRMTLELNDILFNKESKVQNINELEKVLIRFKALRGFQEDRLELMSKKDINGLEQRILLLQSGLKKYNLISIEYFRQINDYLHFLKEKKNSLYNYFEEENNIRFNLFFDIEKLVNDNILKQKELEQLIEIRHFLIQVKNTLLKLPNYFSSILKEVSRKYELGKLILGLKVQPTNQNVIRFLDSMPEIKNGEIPAPFFSQPQLKLSVNKSFLKKKSKKVPQLNVLKSKTDNNITKYLTNPEKQIFDSPEEFMIMFDNIESKNLRLMKENDYIRRNINILKSEYDDVYQSNTIMEKFNDVEIKEERLRQIKEENELLETKFNLLKNNRIIENDLNNKKSEVTRGFFMDLNIFKKIAYYRMLQNYKHTGLLFLEKLIDIIKNFFSLNYSNYGINKAYKLVEKNVLNKILNINKKNINNVNKNVINTYILCLLKLYENICEYIKYKDAEYNSIEENKYIIHKKKEEIQLQRKINNARNIRQLQEEKRLNGIEKIVKKNNKPNLLFKGNVDENIVLKNKIKIRKKQEEIGKYKKNYLEKEFNFYVSYNNDN